MDAVESRTEPRFKLLIVDDSRAIQAILRHAIERSRIDKVDFQYACDGQAALDISLKWKPDLVITDWHMPKLSGLELLETLYSNGKREPAIGFVTTELRPDLLHIARAKGAKFVLGKPFSDSDLIDAVEGALASELSSTSADASRHRDAACKPVKEKDFKSRMEHLLGNVPFRVSSVGTMEVSDLSETNLLALYASRKRNGCYAIAVMDVGSLCTIGGASIRCLPNEIKSSIAKGRPDPKMVTAASKFLGSMADCIYGEDGTLSEMSIAKTTIVTNTFSKLIDTVNRKSGRSDFSIHVPSAGGGRVSWFLIGHS